MKVVLFAVWTVVTAVAAWVGGSPEGPPLVCAMVLFTGYFAWRRRVVLRECSVNTDREEPSACGEPNEVQRWTVNVVAASLGVTGLALGWAVANFGEYSHSFVSQHGGATTGAGVALGLRCLAVVGWASSLRRFGRAVVAGGRRAVSVVVFWAVATAVGYAVLASRDALPVLVVFDVIRSLLGTGLAMALLLPRVRRGLVAPRRNPVSLAV